MAKPLPSFTDGCSLQDKLNELRASETCQWACGVAQRKLGVFFEWTQVSTETGAGHGAGCVSTTSGAELPASESTAAHVHQTDVSLCSPVLILGDFQGCRLKKTLPIDQQRVTSAFRGVKTLTSAMAT